MRKDPPFRGVGVFVLSFLFALPAFAEFQLVSTPLFTKVRILTFSNPPESPETLTSSTIEPVIRLKNEGNETVTSIRINYYIALKNMTSPRKGPSTTWQGTLKPGAEVEVKLNSYRHRLWQGVHRIEAFITKVNGKRIFIDQKFSRFFEVADLKALDARPPKAHVIVSSILSPLGPPDINEGSALHPVILIRNTGKAPLTSTRIDYFITPQYATLGEARRVSTTWQGHLPPGEARKLRLNPLPDLEEGVHLFRIIVTETNGFERWFNPKIKQTQMPYGVHRMVPTLFRFSPRK